jgi:hypothetical protein
VPGGVSERGGHGRNQEKKGDDHGIYTVCVSCLYNIAIVIYTRIRHLRAINPDTWNTIFNKIYIPVGFTIRKMSPSRSRVLRWKTAGRQFTVVRKVNRNTDMYTVGWGLGNVGHESSSRSVRQPLQFDGVRIVGGRVVFRAACSSRPCCISYCISRAQGHAHRKFERLNPGSTNTSCVDLGNQRQG